MATRRHSALTQEFASPTKEELRRRLFDTPQNVFRTRSILQGPIQITRNSVAVFVFFAAALLVGVDIYLFRAFYHSLQGVSHAGTVDSPASAEDFPARIRSPPLIRQKQKFIIPQRQLQPLEEKDWNQYTIRINTWRRPEQLLLSVDWHSRCPGVAQIQVVWCDPENEPPPELGNYDKVVIERHEENNLNERFNILTPPPTLGILSMDDDVLRNCEAIDTGFFKWTHSPERLVGFDGRLHVENENGSWQYGYMSTTEKANRYSMSLTRFCFLHRDYMNIYMNELPRSMLESIATNFNCEDIAMSFLISSLTNGRPPLLADTWAIKSMIKLYVDDKISGGKDHKQLRDNCVDSFAAVLGLKDEGGSRRLKAATLYHQNDPMFDCGDVDRETIERMPQSTRELELQQKIKEWHKMKRVNVQKEFQKLMAGSALEAYRQGFVEGTDKWKERFQHDKRSPQLVQR